MQARSIGREKRSRKGLDPVETPRPAQASQEGKREKNATDKANMTGAYCLRRIS